MPRQKRSDYTFGYENLDTKEIKKLAKEIHDILVQLKHKEFEEATIRLVNLDEMLNSKEYKNYNPDFKLDSIRKLATPGPITTSKSKEYKDPIQTDSTVFLKREFRKRLKEERDIAKDMGGNVGE